MIKEIIGRYLSKSLTINIVDDVPRQMVCYGCRQIDRLTNRKEGSVVFEGVKNTNET